MKSKEKIPYIRLNSRCHVPELTGSKGFLVKESFLGKQKLSKVLIYYAKTETYTSMWVDAQAMTIKSF